MKRRKTWPLPRKKIDKLAKELSKIARDPKTLEDAEEMHKKISYARPAYLPEKLEP